MLGRWQPKSCFCLTTAVWLLHAQKTAHTFLLSFHNGSCTVGLETCNQGAARIIIPRKTESAAATRRFPQSQPAIHRAWCILHIQNHKTTLAVQARVACAQPSVPQAVLDCKCTCTNGRQGHNQRINESQTSAMRSQPFFVRGASPTFKIQMEDKG